MIKFDVESDPAFQTCLDDLGPLRALAVLEALADITAANYSWTDFVSQFGWNEVIRQGEQTYPGAVPLYEFVIKTTDSEFYELFGSTFDEVIIFCAVARIAELDS